MRIAFLTPYMIIGGAETYIITKSKWLLSHGHNIIVISGGGENVVNLPIGTKHINFNTEISPASFSKKEYKKYIAQLSTILIKEQIDLIEAHNTSPVIHAAMSFRITGIPFLINILNERTYLYNPFLKQLTANLAPFGLLYTLTTQMQSYIEKRIKHSIKATIIPIPVENIQEHNAPHNGRYVLSVCRMAADKMYIKYLIKDFLTLHKESKIPKDYRLLIVGDGTLRNEVQILANQNTQIIKMLGTVVGKELEELYRNAEIYVGTGTSLLLGASCKTPCLIPGFTETSMPYCWGIWGERPEDKDVLSVSELQHYPRSTYADTLNELIQNPSKRIIAGQKAYTLYQQYYTFQSIMERWEKEYTKIITIFDNKKITQEIYKKSNISIIINRFRPLWLLRNLVRK